MTPLPLRTVRPFVIESVVLSEVAEEEDFDLSDQMQINKFLKAKVSDLTPKQTFAALTVLCRSTS